MNSGYLLCGFEGREYLVGWHDPSRLRLSVQGFFILALEGGLRAFQTPKITYHK